MLQSSEYTYGGKSSSPASNPNSYNPVKTVSAPVEQATIGRTLVIKGEISGAEALYIDGRIEGKISISDNRISSDATADNVGDARSAAMFMPSTSLDFIYSTCRPTSVRPIRPEPTDATGATGADLDLDPDRGLPGHPGHLRARQACAGRDRRQPLDDGAALNLVRADPDDVTANHVGNANPEAHANEFGVPD